MYAQIRYVCSLTHRIFYGSVHELALTRFIVCLRRQFVHYVINSQPPRFRALLSAYADGLFVNGLEKNKCRFCGACFFRHPLHYKHIYSEMLLDFLSNVMPALCICYCFLLFLYFSLAHIKKLAVFQIYAILDLNVILRKMYHQSKSSYTCFLTYFNLFILCRILPVQTFYGCNQVLFFCIII